MKFAVASLFAGLALKAAAAATTLDQLASSVDKTESIREIKDVTATFAQLAQFGRYAEMAALFASDGLLVWGNASAKGPDTIRQWLTRDAGDMNGIQPGSLDAIVIATPVVNLAPDGKTAKGRFNGLRFQGDGKGNTRMQGGIYENEYARVDGRWKISVLRYYALYEGNYADGWRNIGHENLGPPPPFHYTPDEAGTPVPLSTVTDKASGNTTDFRTLQYRIDKLNDEDEVRNLQHAYGYYVDRRMWNDVVDLFGNQSGTIEIDNVGHFEGPQRLRTALEQWMGPEGLGQGVLNEHLLFNTIVSIRSNVSLSINNTGIEKLADSRGLEIGLIGDAAKGTASWRFSIFRNTFAKSDGIWRMLNVSISPIMVANYSGGWSNGSMFPSPATISLDKPLFLDYSRDETGKAPMLDGVASLEELERRLNRSAAYDGVENVSNAYGYYMDFIDGKACADMAALHAQEGNKESPFAGFYQTPRRIREACTAAYGTGEITNRSGVSFHWRPQPVIHVSHDGRSANLRARLLQPATGKAAGSAQLRGGMYQDQMALEDGIWRLWSVTIDEFYWGVSSWKDGWSGVKPRAANASNPAPRDLIKQYPPDLLLTEMGDPRETGFQGGSGRYVAWPEIQRMWFGYQNPVSGRVPESYWPLCVPCQHRPEWKLSQHGWLEPPAGPPWI
ncbi:hypothetical protein QBC47DRAFT_292967 [Echria macrotheca]|uniref:SnoaL-like domain-containing protein n=1 Tax=Echria macrotheca TaxID=438768 RepID=A0AAJ0BLH7_9PEZI|nr:hypothetical protein QBC47DRAFT_292967 [Echria macrotheca]